MILSSYPHTAGTVCKLTCTLKSSQWVYGGKLLLLMSLERMSILLRGENWKKNRKIKLE